MRLLAWSLATIVLTSGAVYIGYDHGFVDGRKHGYKQCLIEQDGPQTARTFRKGADHAR
jgi:hypothetical protein